MKYFLPLVQEMEVKIPVPVCENVAHAATTRTCLTSVMLPGKFDSESRCLTPTVLLSHPSYCPPWPPKSTQQLNQILQLSLPASSAHLHSAITQKGEHQIGFPTITQTNIIKVFAGLSCPCDSA